MKITITSLAIAALAAVAVSGSAFAQGADTYSGLLSATQIKGAKVMNMENQEIGDINEVLVDPDSGRVRYAVLSVGGYLGVGDTEVAVPWEAMQVSKQGDKAKYQIDATKERLQKAPRVEGKRYDRLYSRRDAEPVYSYWSIAWYDFGPMASPSPSPRAKTSPSPRATASPSPRMSPTPSPSASP